MAVLAIRQPVQQPAFFTSIPLIMLHNLELEAASL